jgi:hypothetical protein
VTDARLDSELRDSKARLEAELCHDVNLFCYPNGDYDERVSHSVYAAGYKSAVTVESGLNEPGCDLLKLRRVHTQSDFTRFVQYTSGLERSTNRQHPVDQGRGTAGCPQSTEWRLT